MPEGVGEPRQGAGTSAVSVPPYDLRAFIQGLSDCDRLLRVDSVTDWNLEIGYVARSAGRPVLFENIQGYPGQRLFANGLCDRSAIALALGIDPEIPYADLITEARKRIAVPLGPVMVERSPVRQNVLTGDSVDLLRLPVPRWSVQDAGRYLGTWHVNVTKDPKTGKRNAGVYRMQILGPRQATVSASTGSDLARHVALAEEQGTALPLAVAIGVPESVVVAAAAACPAGMDEYELAGALQQKPVELIPSGTAGLEVPASSEIVVEGFIHSGIRVQDGPFLDYCGIPDTNPNAFLFEATALLWRNDPVFRGSAIGMPGAEDHQLFAFLAQLDLVDFHGSRKRQEFQNVLWKRQDFRKLQKLGKASRMFTRIG